VEVEVAFGRPEVLLVPEEQVAVVLVVETQALQHNQGQLIQVVVVVVEIRPQQEAVVPVL
jgi:hypothetical protein